MTEIEIDNEVAVPDELTLLKERADLMKIQYHPSIGVEKLRSKINEVLSPEETEKPVHVAAKPKPSKADIKRMYHTRLRKEANKLVRIRLTCMNPTKKNWPGEVLTVSNAVIGTIKKYVPFNAEDGYHVPQVIYEMLKSRRYPQYSTVKLPNGMQKKTSKLVKEFSIELLTPLNAEQMKDLEERQAMNHSIDR